MEILIDSVEVERLLDAASGRLDELIASTVGEMRIARGIGAAIMGTDRGEILEVELF